MVIDCSFSGTTSELGDSAVIQEIAMSPRIRSTPYTSRVEQYGVSSFTVVNHMLLPKGFQTTVEEDYWHLRSHVQIWDVSCERQVEISGPDAMHLVQLMTPRDITVARIGQCLYAPVIDRNAGIVNDPVLLKIAEDRYWLSVADSDLILFALGIAHGVDLNTNVTEPDVSPLAVQGPKAEDLMVKVFGEKIRELKYFNFGWFDFHGTNQIIARTGYSRQDGFEIFLNQSNLGAALWDAVWEAGKQFNISPGCPNLIDRIEAGLLSYGNEITRDNNPLEAGWEKYCTLDGSIDFLGKSALLDIAKSGVSRQIRGVLFDGDFCPVCSEPWPVLSPEDHGVRVGQITSAIFSPRLGKNIGLAMIDREFWTPGLAVTVMPGDGALRNGFISALPFK